MKYNITVRNKSKTHTCCENKHLMDGLYVCEDLVPKACHNGACGLCKIKIHSGEFKKSKMNRKHVSCEEESNDILLACKVFPRSDMEIEFLPCRVAQAKSKCYVLGS